MSTISDSVLHDVISGPVITPGHPEFDEARSVFYGGVDRKPRVIFRPTHVSDVARVIQFARDSGLPLAIRGGGHSLAGYSGVDDGVVIDLKEMKSLQIDPIQRIAWAGAGLTAGEYTKSAGSYGLATGFGDTGSVGISGLTLGGGLGYLSRKFGMTIDDLISVEIVTAEGQVLDISADSHPDLFWAIRGGGGNFGVVTRLQYRLHEVATIFGGILLLPAAPDTIHTVMTELENAPDELTAFVNIMPAPPMPFVPKEYIGKMVMMLMIAFTGPLDSGQQVVAPFRTVAKPIADLLHPMPYPDLFPPEQPGYHPVAAAKSIYMDKFDREAAETIMECLQASTANMAVTQMRVLGGAISRVPNDATAYAFRDRKIMTNVAAIYASPDQKAEHTQWVDSFAAELQRGGSGVYVNFLGDEGPDRVREAYPGLTWDRLVAVKTRYDPENVFHTNQNIPPARPNSRILEHSLKK